MRKDNISADLVDALIRETLKRTGRHKSLAAYDAEVPRSATAITSRSGITHGLRIEKLVKRHQDSEQPLPSLLYLLVDYLAHRDGKISGAGVPSQAAARAAPPSVDTASAAAPTAPAIAVRPPALGPAIESGSAEAATMDAANEGSNNDDNDFDTAAGGSHGFKFRYGTGTLASYS